MCQLYIISVLIGTPYFAHVMNYLGSLFRPIIVIATLNSLLINKAVENAVIPFLS